MVWSIYESPCAPNLAFESETSTDGVWSVDQKGPFCIAWAFADSALLFLSWDLRMHLWVIICNMIPISNFDLRQKIEQRRRNTKIHVCLMAKCTSPVKSRKFILFVLYSRLFRTVRKVCIPLRPSLSRRRLSTFLRYTSRLSVIKRCGFYAPARPDSVNSGNRNAESARDIMTRLRKK